MTAGGWARPSRAARATKADSVWGRHNPAASHTDSRLCHRASHPAFSDRESAHPPRLDPGMRHIMRRIKHVQEQVAGTFESRHVDDRNNVIDVYCKYVSGKKAAMSVTYLANRRLAAPVVG